MIIPIAFGHFPQHRQQFDCKDCGEVPTADYENLGKELAIFIHSNTPGGFWDGVRVGCELLRTHCPCSEEEARKLLFPKLEVESDEEEAVFER